MKKKKKKTLSLTKMTPKSESQHHQDTCKTRPVQMLLAGDSY
jgi:hypothetical protein